MNVSISEKTEQLRRIRDELLAFEASPFFKYRQENNYFPVIGEGDHDADIIFIGEAPGKNEAETAKPFCGASGKILDQLLESAGIGRGDVYITNVVKDRPPANRDPSPAEIELYAPFLERQIDIIQPKAIATLGRFSMQYIMEKYGLAEAAMSISQNHGRSFDAGTSYGKIKIIPLYHPAVAVYNRTKLDELKADFQQLKRVT
ncbi:MAG: uracil-DNA glycosylase [Patescibacteria group bacterium]|nr:uracil-DNA glycosylase [Patescibacteria group bacterium]